ncbi:MAG: mechanosensitive ion channel [Betaproteobacteria bacterium]|nr:mechanosensitive ion channel [Betaproteobacteria bacterium]
MSDYGQLGSSIGASFSQIGARLVEYAPSVLGATLLLLVGWFVARLLRGMAVKLMSVLEVLLHRMFRGRAASAPSMPSASVEIVGSILFWVVILFFVAAATQVLGLDVFTAWLKDLVAYLPTLLAGGLIILAGVLLSGLARDVTVAALTALPEPQRLLLGRVVQGTVLLAAVVVGADQIGIKITFLVILAAVVAGAVVSGVALAVSLGARTFVANLIGAHYLRQAFDVGQRVRVAGFEGRILELTTVSLVLESEEGRVTVPAKVYHEEPIVLLLARNGDA